MTVCSSDLPPSTISYHLSVLNSKVEEVAERAGVLPSSRLDLETCLAALPWRERRHLTLLLESVRVHANSPALQDAVRLIQKLAADVWAQEPPPDLSKFQHRLTWARTDATSGAPLAARFRQAKGLVDSITKP